MSGLKVDAANLSGLEANRLTREGVSAPVAGCDMSDVGYFRYMGCRCDMYMIVGDAGVWFGCHARSMSWYLGARQSSSEV